MSLLLIPGTIVLLAVILFGTDYLERANERRLIRMMLRPKADPDHSEQLIAQECERILNRTGFGLGD